MTFSVYFHSEHALLWSVRYALETFPTQDDDPYAYLAAGSVCVLSCADALEAIVNDLIKARDRLSHWDELRLASKIDTIAELEGQEIDWGVLPWQEISRLIRTRNWLAHYKDPYVDLSGAEGAWISDAINKPPRIDPSIELAEESISRFYTAVRKAGLQLSKLVTDSERYVFLETEEYRPIIS